MDAIIFSRRRILQPFAAIDRLHIKKAINMNNSLNRRTFIKRAALAAGAVSAANLLPAPAFARRKLPKEKLNIVQIGCGGRGTEHLKQTIGKHAQNLYAIVDPDDKKRAAFNGWLKKNNYDPAKTQHFTDYRQMFDRSARTLTRSSSLRQIIITPPPR